MKAAHTPWLIGILAVAACTVEVTDETSSPLTYDPPLNVQNFRVRVNSDATVANVDVVVPGIGTDTMTSTGGNLYEGELPLAACSEIAEFAVEVTTNQLFSNPVDRFPEAGNFTHPIVALPDECEDFADEVSQTFTVDRVEDFPDFILGNGTCGGVIDNTIGCSLRAAVMEANARPGPDLIRIPINRYILTRTGDEEGDEVNDSVNDLDITDSVTIEGVGGSSRDVWDFLIESFDRSENLRDDPDENSSFVKIDGGGIGRVFHVVGDDTVVRLRNLAIVNGRGEFPGGGGILNAGTLVLERVAIADNEVTGGGVGFGGAGIRNDGMLIADDIAITQNAVTGSIENPAGGALDNHGTATIRRALLAYNSARFGNAIDNDDDDVLLRLENVTIHDHRWGNGMPVDVIENSGEMDLAFVTISGHRIDDGRLLSNLGGAVLRLRNVMMLDNTADHCNGTITTLGGNVTDAPCDLTGTAVAQDADHIDVSLSSPGRLDYRGGFTPVYPFSVPSHGSPFFNPIDRAFVPLFPFFDQRGEDFSRRVDGDGNGLETPDPGAYEEQD